MTNTQDFSGVSLAQAMYAAIAGVSSTAPKRIAVFRDPDNGAATAYAQRLETSAPLAGFEADIRPYPQTLAEFVAIIDKIKCPILPMHPVPDWISADDLVQLIGQARDVEGTHPLHAGAVALGRGQIVPPTAQAAFLIAEHLTDTLVGKTVCIVGASTIVGRPLALLLIQAEATVRVAQQATKDLAAQTKDADIIIAATGVPALINGSHIREGAICIDVGITRVGDQIVGDFDTETVRGRAGWLTMVPDGVGPLTVACLFTNAAKLLSPTP